MIKRGAKCNIAFFAHGDRNVGGGEQSWYFLITKIDRNLFAPIVFYSKRNRVIGKIENEGIPVINLKLHRRITSLYRDQVKFNPLSLFLYGWHLTAAIWKLFWLLKKYGIPLLHVHDNLSKIIGVPAAKLGGIKIITHCNDQLGKALIDRILLSYQRRFMDKIFCVSRCVGNRFARNGIIPKNVVISHSAIEPRRWARTKGMEIKRNGELVVIGMVAVFDKVKGHQYLFQAIKLLVSGGVTNLSCRVIGEGREKNELYKLGLENGLEKYITFLGFVPDLREAMSELDILVVPSLQESFGMAAVEAMAMEIPVIASRVGGLPEVVADGETGVLVPPADPQALADAIKYLMGNPDVRLTMGLEGRERVLKNFDIDKNLKVTEQIIWDLVRGPVRAVPEVV